MYRQYANILSGINGLIPTQPVTSYGNMNFNVLQKVLSNPYNSNTTTNFTTQPGLLQQNSYTIPSGSTRGVVKFNGFENIKPTIDTTLPTTQRGQKGFLEGLNDFIDSNSKTFDMLGSIGQLGLSAIDTYNRFMANRENIKNMRVERGIALENRDYARKERARLDRQRSSLTNSYYGN